MLSPDSSAASGEPEVPAETLRFSRGQWFVIVVALFLVRILPWLISELWYDEVITLTDFAVGPPGRGPLRIFATYPVANNHMLFSLVGWWWIRFLNFNAGEHVLRAPSVLFGFATLWVIVFRWSRWLGHRTACIGGLLVAVSPVFGAFAYQFRGYSLSMFLATLAWTGVLEQRRGNWRRGTVVHSLAAALLVMTIPSNVLVVGAGLIFLLWNPPPGSDMRRRLLSVGIPAAATLLGAVPYLLVAEQFLAVMRQTAGWDSSWAVLGNLCLAALAHGGPLVVCAAAGLRGAASRSETTAGDHPKHVLALRLCACMLGPVAAALVLSGDAPFPRLFVSFLPMGTYALLLAASGTRALRQRSLPVLGLLLLANGLVWERAGTWLTEHQTRQGQHPQNLLQQYYRGNTALRALAAELVNRDLANHAVVVTDAYDFATFRYYWSQNGLPAWAVLAANRSPADAWNHHSRPPGVRLWAVARDEMQAAELFHAAGETRPFYRALTVRDKSMYGLRTD